MLKAKNNIAFSKLLYLELQDRKQRNPRYSLRAFARDLKVTPSKISEILNGKRRVGPRLYAKLLLNLGLPEEEQKRFSDAYIFETNYLHTFGEFARPLAEDEYAVVADPQHFNILSLMETDDFRSDVGWIARRLGVDEKVVQEALMRLKSLGLVIDDEKGGLRPGQNGVTTTHEIPSEVLRNSHKNVISQALGSLDRVPLEERDFSSLTMTMNPERMDEAKELIREFRRKFCRLMENDEKKEVYTLNLQFFPNTVREDQANA